MCLLWWWSVELAISSWALILFSFLLLHKVVKLSGGVWRLDYMHGRHCCHSCGSFIQHNSVIFTERLLSSRCIAKRNLDPVSSSIILPSALTTCLLKKKIEFFIYILSNHLPIKGSSEKYPLEMRNREEMRQNEPGKCASWNAGIISSEMLLGSI